MQACVPGGQRTTATAYSGNTTKVTDPACKWRRSVSDALGRMVEVHEPSSDIAITEPCPAGGEPPLVTTYAYDANDNLTNVLQSSSRPRTFVYDSLSRLTSAANPESGTISYFYTKTDGSLLQRGTPATFAGGPTLAA